MDKLNDVWTGRDYPVLREVTRRIDQGEGHVAASTVAEALGMEREDVGRALAALVRRGLLGEPLVYAETPYPLGVAEVSGAAYLLTGLHPDGDDLMSQLISALHQAADEVTDEDERGRLKRAADALGSFTSNVGAGVLTAVLTKAAGA